MRRSLQVVGVALSLVVLFAAAAFAQAVTPESARAFFDSWAVAFMLVAGALVKHFPGLGGLSNHAIGWLNFVGYALARMFGAGPAEAGILDGLPDAVGVILGGATSAGWAHVLYESLGRSLLTRVLKLKRNDGKLHSFERRA